MAFLLRLVLAGLFVCAANADVYMHNPRGSNNRNCEKNANRQNGARLFDSQNNDAGGYACPRAEPFACYRISSDPNNDPATQACNAQNTVEPTKNLVSKEMPHNLIGKRTEYTPMERFYYVVGSILPIEWTNQHGCGTNSKLECEIVLQVACEDTDDLGEESWRTTLTDDCGTEQTGDNRCQPRDGTPVQNSQDNVNGRATDTIDENSVDEQDDYRYGRHETYRYYKNCRRRERNQGLFAADQKINGKSARFSRQNPNGNRNGLECPEESEHFPYWHPTPWMDIAVLTSDTSRCAEFQGESQNVKAKNYCECSLEDCPNEAGLPNNERDCIEKGGKWKSMAPFGIPAPDCRAGGFTRDNHLGNAQGNGEPSGYNWTIPEWLSGKKACTLRIRYNISTTDLPRHVDSQLNGEKQTILVDREAANNGNNPGREVESYMPIKGFAEDEAQNKKYRLGFAVNTDQNSARTFQDRSYIFEVKPRNEETAGACAESGKIWNLNTRGKRGNIVQAYPNVEYDFVPNKLVMTEDDCAHVQWCGSDYNPNRNPNNGEGGPPDPRNPAEARCDRHNLVQMGDHSANYIDFDSSNYGMFDISKDQWINLAFIGQDIDNPATCKSIESILAEGPNPQINPNAAQQRQWRERYHKNCMKLSGARSPYFDAGVLKAGKTGSYKYMSTRNNNFSNRGQKGELTITDGALGTAAQVGIAIGAVVGAGVVAALGLVAVKKYRSDSRPGHGGKSSFLPSMAGAGPTPKTVKSITAGPQSPAGPTGRKNTTPLKTVSSMHMPPAGDKALAKPRRGSARRSTMAKFDHVPKEDGELAFKKGDMIDVLNKDPSGWWEGKNPRTGQTGLFPSNYLSTHTKNVSQF